MAKESIQYIKNIDQIEPTLTDHGEQIRECIGYSADYFSKNCSLAHVTLPPGKSSLKHYHPETEEFYYVISGTGTMNIGEKVNQIVKTGDYITIPVNTNHQIFNKDESTEDLTFVVFCTPPWTPVCSVYFE